MHTHTRWPKLTHGHQTEEDRQTGSQTNKKRLRLRRPQRVPSRAFFKADMNYASSFPFLRVSSRRDLSMEFRPRVCTFVYMCVNVCVEEGRARRSVSRGEVAGKSARPRSRLSSWCYSFVSLHFSLFLSFYLISIRILCNRFQWYVHGADFCLSLSYKEQSISSSSSLSPPSHHHHHSITITDLPKPTLPFFLSFCVFVVGVTRLYIYYHHYFTDSNSEYKLG